MLNQENIVCFSSIDWDFIWQGHQEIMSTLAAQGHRVLFIENTGIRTPGIRDAGRLKKRLSNWYKGTQGIRKQSENLYIYSPLILPFPYSKLAVQLNTYILKRQLQHWFESLHFYNPIFWTFLPTALASNLITKINPKLSVYYCIDNLEASSPQAKKIRRDENNLLKTVDLAFATSHKLLENCKKYNAQSHFFPFGVSLENFNSTQKPQKPIELKAISNPILGYIGGIHKWIDFDLVHTLATRLPDFQFGLVGPIQTDVSKLASLKNITFTGKKDRTELPNFAYYFDHCLIPYRMHEYTNCVYPTKLNEYLALGKSVISTPIREIILFNQKHGDIVKVAKTAAEFQNHIQKGENEIENIQQKRVDIAKTNAWPNRISEMNDLISKKIQEKQDETQVHWSNQLKHISKKYRSAFLKPAVGLLLFYILLFRSPLPWFMAQPLRIDKPLTPVDVIITLGGGVGESGQAGQGYQERVAETVRLFQEGYGKYVIFSSGYAYQFHETKIMHALAVESGIPNDKIFIEKKSRNTHENIKFSYQIMQKKGFQSAIFVSSPYHSKRVALTATKNFPKNTSFQTYGVQNNSYFSGFQWYPKLYQMKAILHEYAAIVYYKFKKYI